MSLDYDYDIDAPETAPAIGRVANAFFEAAPLPELPPQESPETTASAWARLIYDHAVQTRHAAKNLGLLMVPHHYAPAAPTKLGFHGLIPTPYDPIVLFKDHLSLPGVNASTFY